ncbi:MAG: hypothetical protein GY711_29375 [bacterium]|nr:hypothetical protein [bacterium]
MIAPLRKRHRRMVNTLAVVLPIGFAAAIAARPSWPTNDVEWWPGAGIEAGHAGTRTWTVDALDLELGLTAAGMARPWSSLTVRPGTDPRLPDVLVYLAPSASPAESVPEDAHLLGKLAGADARTFTWIGPPPTEGCVYFYSLAHRELVATSVVPEG